MKKLTLAIDTLKVETFNTEAVAVDGKGTVEAFRATNIHQNTCNPQVGTCFGYTCYATCIC